MKNIIKYVLILLLPFLTSCYYTDDDDVYVANCNETVSSVYYEGPYDGYYTGYNQYTVYTYDSYGNSYVYYDQPYTYSGACY